jgi:hypothetical protein
MAMNGVTKGATSGLDERGASELEAAPSPKSIKLRHMVDRLREVRVPLRGFRLERDGQATGVEAMPMARPLVVPTSGPDAPTTDHRLAGFDLRSVGSMAVRFYGCAIAVALAAAVVFWILGSMLGVVGAFEKFMRGIGFTGFHVLSLQLLVGVTFVAAVFAAFLVGITVVSAALYNALARQHGGVRVLIAAAPASHLAVDGVNANGTNGNGHSNGNGNRVKGKRTNGNGANGNGTNGTARAARTITD